MIYVLICGAGLILAVATIVGIGAIFDNSLEVKDIDRIIDEVKDVKHKVENSIIAHQNIDYSRNTMMDLKRHNAALLNDIDHLELLRKRISEGALVTESEEPELQNILDHISSARSYLSHL